MLEKFKENIDSVLLRHGQLLARVDVPGEALVECDYHATSIAVPDHPLIEARLEKNRSRRRQPVF
jgi:hypothetical protein